MKYKIEYSNGFTQHKNLITEDIYSLNVKPLIDLAQYYSSIGDKHKEKSIKSRIKKEFGDYFTDKSPLGLAINTGVITLPFGDYPCKITLI